MRNKDRWYRMQHNGTTYVFKSKLGLILQLLFIKKTDQLRVYTTSDGNPNNNRGE